MVVTCTIGGKGEGWRANALTMMPTILTSHAARDERHGLIRLHNACKMQCSICMQDAELLLKHRGQQGRQSFSETNIPVSTQ